MPPESDVHTHATGEEVGTEPSLRASSEERETVVASLHTAVGDGRLLLEEAEERIINAYAARYRHELAPLLADLPETADVATSGWSTLWRAAVAQARLLCVGPSAGNGPPTTGQLRVAALVVALAFLWLVLAVVIGFVAGALA